MFYKLAMMLYGIFKNLKTRNFQVFPNYQMIIAPLFHLAAKYQMIAAYFLSGEPNIK